MPTEAEIDAAIREHYRAMGRKGAAARNANTERPARQRLASVAALARWAKVPRVHWMATPRGYCDRKDSLEAAPARSHQIDTYTSEIKNVTCPTCRAFERDAWKQQGGKLYPRKGKKHARKS